MKPSGSRPPFFCVHALFGSAFPYHLLALHLDPDQPFYSLQARGLDGAQAPFETVEEMASAYIAAIRMVRPRGPYHLGGYSFGGLVAYEMAQQLVRQGERIAVLAMFGTGAPSPAGNVMASQLSLFIKTLEDFQRLVVNSALSDHLPGAETWAWMRQFQGAWPPMARVTTANGVAALRYQPRPYLGGVDVFLTEDLRQLSPGDPTLGWKACCSGRVEIHPVAGTHLGMFQEPEVRELAKKLTLCLNNSEPGEGP